MSQRLPRILRPFHRADGTVRGDRVAAVGALVIGLTLVTAYAGALVQRSGTPDAGGYALLVILLAIKLPALGLLLAIMTRQLRRVLPEQQDTPEILHLEDRLTRLVRLPERQQSIDDARRLEQDAWAYAHRAPGVLGTRAAEVALTCARLSVRQVPPNRPRR